MKGPAAETWCRGWFRRRDFKSLEFFIGSFLSITAIRALTLSYWGRPRLFVRQNICLSFSSSTSSQDRGSCGIGSSESDLSGSSDESEFSPESEFSDEDSPSS